MQRLSLAAAATILVAAGCTCTERGSFKAADAVVAVSCPRTCEEGTNWFFAAASDLTNILCRVTGRQVALCEEASLPSDARHVIYLGDTMAAKSTGLDAGALKRMEFRIKADGRNAFIL
ncbi:MAG: hypothetical protein MJ249_13415, partial [Kiritimatiellae bacterium]|nr:hypothetical protein [Kiritimatiellia bacterium]